MNTNKYDEIINNSSGKVLKIEEWGLINLSNKIKNYIKLKILLGLAYEI